MNQKYHPSCGTCTHEKAVCRFCVQQSKHSDYYSPEKAFQDMRNRKVTFTRRMTTMERITVAFFVAVILYGTGHIAWMVYQDHKRDQSALEIGM